MINIFLKCNFYSLYFKFDVIYNLKSLFQRNSKEHNDTILINTPSLNNELFRFHFYCTDFWFSRVRSVCVLQTHHKPRKETRTRKGSGKGPCEACQNSICTKICQYPETEGSYLSAYILWSQTAYSKLLSP